MAAKTTQPTYNDRVFINCPFDDTYLLLLRAIVFTVYRCGFYPTSAMSEDNALDNRIDKIARIIEKCRYGIHDISRTEPNSAGWPRFNMPFELGVFYGARRYGPKSQKTKNALILERVRYSYQQFLSDINGVDIRAHENDLHTMIRHVRNWLNTNSGRKTIPGAQTVWNHYQNFLLQLPDLSDAIGFPDLNQLPFADFCNIVEEWLEETC